MKILSLSAENVMRLQVVEIKPSPTGLVIISGKNGAGKSSVLDSITLALSGADSLPSKPVRRGEDKARVEIDLGELHVTRTVTVDGGGSLTVRNKNHEKLKSPQAILDALFTTLTFDPMEFLAMKSSDRFESLRALVGLNFDDTEKEIKRIYDDRTAINREVKTIEANLKLAPEHEGIGTEEQSPAELQIKLQEAFEAGDRLLSAARKHNEANAKIRAKVDEVRNGLKSVDLAIENYKATVADLKKQLAKHEANLAGAQEAREAGLKALAERQKEVEALHDEDEKAIVEQSKQARTPIQNAIIDLDKNNRKARDNRKKADFLTNLKSKTREADSMSDQIDKLEKSKRDAIQNARFPVPGLSLSDSKEVMFNNIPFDQCSTGEQIRISVAMGLAMNPKLRVLLIRQGNDLDDDNLKLVADMAEQADAQVWIERVHAGSDVAVVIEDGQVKGASTKEEKQETLAV